ncbi:hypothetical protein ANRL4_03093 [Anaerolineae bacterium]|nr:hypothetical protein ANRL4_03093 [Anaerolineae bacterium]
MADPIYWPLGKNALGVIKATEDAQPAPTTRHFMWVKDHSGSMHWARRQMAEAMVQHLSEIPDGSYLSLAWFSGAGQYRWYVKGFKIGDDADRKKAAELIRHTEGSWCMTAYSEVIADMQQVIKDLSTLADSHSLVFLTDGYPNDDRGGRAAIFEAIKDVADSLTDVTLVGFGDYYHRALMTEMAKAFGGTLVHADEVQRFGDALAETIKIRTTKRGKTIVTLPPGVSLAFSVSPDGKVIVLDVNEGQVAAPAGQNVYFPTAKKVETTPITVDAESASYALALAQLRSGDTDASLKTLGDLGDVKVVQMLSTAITNAEFGAAEELIEKCVSDKQARFAAGRKPGCLPNPNAPDLMDALDWLIADPDAKFFPYHAEFKYKRIGRGTEVDGDFPKFEPKKDHGVALNTLTWNEKRLNLSVLAKIPGAVKLINKAPSGTQASEVGFADTFPCLIWRNYALVSNGFLNVKVLPARFSYDTFNQLRTAGCIDEACYDPNHVYPVHLDRVPVLSRGKAKKDVSALDYAMSAVQSELLGARLKVLNALRKELDPNDEQSAKTTPYSEEQRAVLEANGIDWNNGSYNPPTKKTDPTDVLQQREFTAKIAGFSSLPTLDKLREKAVKVSAWNGKGKEPKFTAAEEAMCPALEQFTAETDGFTTEQKLAWLTTEIMLAGDKKRTIDAALNLDKYAMLMTGQWFKGYQRGETKVGCVIDGKDFEVAFDTRQVEVKI